MLSFIKRIFTQPEAPSSPAPTVPPTSAAPASAPASASPVPPSGPPAVEGDCIQIAIADIAAKLTGKMAPRPGISLGGKFSLPVKTALAQLPSGAVRVRFAQLRAAAPGIFSDDPSLDEALVDLPLQRILPAINPSMLPRRTDQAQVEVPEDVTGLFGGREKASNRVVLPKPEAAPVPVPTPAPAPSPVAAPVPPVPAPIPVPVPKPVAPPVPVPAPRAPAPIISPIAPSPIAPSPVSAAPAPVISPIAPAPAPVPAPIISPIASVPAMAPAPVPLPAASKGAAVTAKLSALYEFWPDAVRQEITRSNLANASVALPMDRLESAMKTGRVQFTWGEISQWLDGAPAPGASPQGQTAVELPLKVIAPLFMAKRAPAAPQKKIVVSENIPDLFAGIGQASVQAAPAPAAEPAAAPLPAPAPAAPNVFGEIFGQPAKAEWSPQEITQGINKLPGVMASLIAMNDGFLVAGDLPTPLKSDTTAAFLPQMFGRLAHYSNEIQLGALNSLTLNAAKSKCAVFKAGNVFLAVIGNPGESLPDAQLQKVAAELAERNQ